MADFSPSSSSCAGAVSVSRLCMLLILRHHRREGIFFAFADKTRKRNGKFELDNEVERFRRFAWLLRE
jgi:hypothetical protein